MLWNILMIFPFIFNSFIHSLAFSLFTSIIEWSNIAFRKLAVTPQQLNDFNEHLFFCSFAMQSKTMFSMTISVGVSVHTNAFSSNGNCKWSVVEHRRQHDAITSFIYFEQSEERARRRRRQANRIKMGIARGYTNIAFSYDFDQEKW